MCRGPHIELAEMYAISGPRCEGGEDYKVSEKGVTSPLFVPLHARGVGIVEF